MSILRRPSKLTVFGVGAGLLYGLILYGVMTLLHSRSGLFPAYFAFLFGAPIAAASLAVVIAPPRKGNGNRNDVKTGVRIAVLMVLGSVVVLREGAVCVAVATPIIIPAAICGAVITGEMLRSRRRHLSVVILALPLVGMPIESVTDLKPVEETVSTSVDIKAPPAVVWRNTINIRNIHPGELHWTVTKDLLGVPRPIDAQLFGQGVGAIRQLTWANDVHFQEIVTGWRPGARVTWRFRFDPNQMSRVIDQHIRFDKPYLQVEDGDYELIPLANGSTRLTLTSHYRLKLVGEPYLAMWGALFFGDFHGNVLDVIRRRSEAEVGPA